MEKQSVLTVLLAPEFRLREMTAEICGDAVEWRIASDDCRSVITLEGGPSERLKVEEELRRAFGDLIVRDGDVAFVRDLVGALRKRKMTLCAAESCTGGLIAKLVTDVVGSSSVFWGGFVTYDNEAKCRILGVSEKCLKDFGAVSLETVREMALGALEKSGTSCSLAVSGIAGPGGGSPEKPVGTVCIGAACKDGLFCGKRFRFRGSRDRIRTLSAYFGLILLESLVLKGECLDMDIPYDYI